MKIKNISSSEIWTFVKNNWGLLIPLTTGVLFTVGYISARVFFSYWHVPYTEISDALSPFEFLLQKPSMLFYSMTVIALLTFLIAFAFSDTDSGIEEWHVHIKNPINYIVIVGPILVIFLWIKVSPDNSKEQIKGREYIPYHVVTGDFKGSYRCVHVLANIADYLVLIQEDLQPVILKENSVLSIRAMMQPYPRKEIPHGRSTITNENYESEKNIWDKHWESVCYNQEEYSFKVFDFNTLSPEKKQLH